MGRSRTVTLTLEPDFRWVAEALAQAQSSRHTASEWDVAFKRMEAVLRESVQHVSSLCAQIAAAGLTPAHLATLAELAAHDDRPMPTHGLHVTREQVEYALKRGGA